MSMNFYPAGSKRCEVCGDPLDAIVCYRGKEHFICNKRSCARTTTRPLKLISGHKCEGPGCPNLVPPMLYPGKPKHFFCSSRCTSNYEYSRRSFVQVKCSYCGEKLRRLPDDAAGLHFCPGHYNKFIGEQRDEEECGCFFKLYQLVLKNFCEGHYNGLAAARCELRQFFRFLDESKITKLSAVTADVVSKFLARPGKHRPRADYVKKMFDFLIHSGRFKGPNPVMSRVHYPACVARPVLPYSEEEMAQISATVEARGSTQVKFILSAADDFGPRRSEMCKMRIPDINWRRRIIRVRNPTKSLEAGEVPFSRRTKSLLRAWLKERGTRNHRFILINSKGGQLRPTAFTYLLKGTLLKKWHGHIRTLGLDSFQFHRLRHNNTTMLDEKGVEPETNMKVHHWGERASMGVYLTTSEREIAEGAANAWKVIETGRGPLSVAAVQRD
jgi:integrase